MNNDNDPSLEIAKQWLDEMKHKSNFIPLNGQNIRFNTPFIDPFGDEYKVLIRSKSSSYEVTDQGYTIWNLKSRGNDVTKKDSTRMNIVNGIISDNNVSLKPDNNALYKEVYSKSEVAQAINQVLDSMMKVSDLVFTSRSKVKKIFKEDVLDYLSKNKKKFSYDLGFRVNGKSNMSYNLDFVFRKNLSDARWTKIYTSLTKDVAERAIGIWLDTDIYRNNNPSVNATFNILVQDIDLNKNSFVGGLKNHNINVVDFNNKKQFEDAFAIEQV